MPGSSTVAQIEGFCISLLNIINTIPLFEYYRPKNPLKPMQVPIREVPNFLKNIK